ncbi:SDR family NAD(P)-dependent oxidoreductase [Actinoplanes siamensis]|uniref:Short-chain dehydrogenase n=1 Tax=Actinoplanes siamensis TaxID=1223317 RepID=A0A919NA44_9ACTN|nr:SDR family oxidoreductase [Actinoplanes siamensis]GIF07097.1 short-chain dehydrogenase [Actinoplanes siamensis]
MPDARTALVTGANRGIGRAVAAELHRRGLRVILTARAQQEAAAAAAEIGAGATGLRLDVTSDDAVRELAVAAGPVDVLVSNAGVLLEDGAGDPLTVGMDVVERTLEVNLLGAWRVAQAFVPAMVAGGWGRVVFVSSGTGSFSAGLFTGSPAYALSKSGLNGLTQLLATATKGTGVLVNAVNPGPTRTRMMPHGRRSVQDAAVDVADAALLPDDGPSGTFRRGEQVFGW